MDAWTCRATAHSPYRARVIEKLGLSPSVRVLDVACGTGLNFDLLQQALDGEGELVGLDYSPKTLTRAWRKVQKQGWTNVVLVESDSASYRPQAPFDAALCTFASDIIPPWRETIQMMADAVHPGGRLAFIGFKESTRRGYRCFNPLWRALSIPFGGVELGRDVRQELLQYGEEEWYEEVYGRFYYLLVGTRT